MQRRFVAFLFVTLFTVVTALSFGVSHSQAQTSTKPYLVEWVYRIKYGYQEEWWRLFLKYQIATLDKEKELGFVTNYQVVRPGLHTSEDARWDYRIVITYKDAASAAHGGEVEKSLFPDAESRKKDENRRWELTTNHWDLPIRDVDPHAVE
jgi:hypothetical protein